MARRKVEKQWFTVDEVAAEFGVSRGFIISQINEGQLKAFHPKKIYKINKFEKEAWVERYSNV
jgi:excisionase family DNA binding protein